LNRPQRYLSTYPLPKYAYLPGKNRRGERVLPSVLDLNVSSPEQSEYLRYGLDLYNHGFFWETHECLEILWNAERRQGPTADFLKAWIHLAAAALKIRLNRPESALRHTKRAEGLIGKLLVTHQELLGFDLKIIESKIRERLALGLEGVRSHFEIHPRWK